MNKLLLLIALAFPIAVAASSSALADDAGVGSGSSSAGSGSGSAAPIAPPAVTVDPAQPVASVVSAEAAIKEYGIVWGGMAILFGVGTLIVKKNDETHWLSQGYTLPIAVGAVGAIGAAINARFAGGTWTSVLAAVTAAIFLVFQKPVPGTSMTPPPAPAKA